MGKLIKMSDDKLRKITKIWEEQLYNVQDDGDTQVAQVRHFAQVAEVAQVAESPGSWASRPRRAR